MDDGKIYIKKIYKLNSTVPFVPRYDIYILIILFSMKAFKAARYTRTV